MILGVRALDGPKLRGFQALLIREWTLPIQVPVDKVFSSFDESFLRLQQDPDATRIGPFRDASDDLKLIHTAHRSALKSLPERLRHQSELFTVAQSRQDPQSMDLYWPRWLPIEIESESGSTWELQSLSRQWKTEKLESLDRRLLLRTHPRSDSYRLDSGSSRLPSSHYRRLSELFAQPSSCPLQLSVKLFS